MPLFTSAGSQRHEVVMSVLVVTLVLVESKISFTREDYRILDLDLVQSIL